MESNLCIACGSIGQLFHSKIKDLYFGSAGSWSLIKCTNRKCRHVWISPRPSTQDLIDSYSNYYTHLPPDAKNSIDENSSPSIPRKLWRFFRRALSSNDVHIKREAMYLLGREPGVVLDIGCGNGKLATMLHSYGWEVCGQEFDVKAASIAKSRGVKVFVGELDAIVGAHIYDAIVMNHVVEHIPDPVNLLRNCKRLLKENGRLVITTPNADSLGAVLFQSYWRGYEAPRHLNIFTPKSLRSILFKSGFDNPVLSTLEFEAGTISFQSMSKFLQEHFKVDISSNYFIIRIFSAAFYLFEKILISFNPRLGEEILLVVDLKVCAELENE